jgi:hypothetical protein
MTNNFKEKRYGHPSLDFETGRSIMRPNHDLSHEEFEELFQRGNNVAIPTCVGDWEGKKEIEKGPEREGKSERGREHEPEEEEIAEASHPPDSTRKVGSPGLWPDGPLDPEKWTRAMIAAPVELEHVETRVAGRKLKRYEEPSVHRIEEGREHQRVEERYRARSRATSFRRAMEGAE